MFGAAPALAILPAAALAMPAPAAPPIVDPIFAAIERDKAAQAFRNEESKVIRDWIALQRERRPGWKKKCDRVTKADFDRADAACKIERESYEALLATVPMTVGGMRAFLQYTARSGADTLLKSPLFAGMSAEEFDHA
jgi:hypothetical protein